MHVYGELCLSAHDTVEKDRRSVRGFADPQRNEGVATAVCEAGNAKMSKDLAKCPPELVVSGQEQSKRLRPTGRKPGVVAGHGYAGAARRRRGAKGCSGSRAARGATRTRGLASASDSRASRHVHKSYERLACNAAWREGAAPSSTSSGSGSARRSARVEVPQGTQNKIFGAGRAVLFISDMSPAGEPSSRPRRARVIKFAYATIFVSPDLERVERTHTRGW